ncbi:SDR family NAD(P)-dependent oxidoreductase [Tateyamaria sp. SN3-11]|uniref:SDR family NAD(P)-dependent oxidoreductase n=1 Tax=Tateyamaria sp. SN3-11 TaxID=3092147 RepID=UPI0039ECD040
MSNRKVAVITGSTGGIGGAIAEQLAAGGWDLVLVNRSGDKSSKQKTDLNTAHPPAKVDLVQADLMDTDQIKRAAREILAIHSSIDALYNNSGVLTSQRVMSAQGHESNYAVNTLAPYVMLECLRPALKRTAGNPKTMVVNTTSAAHTAAKSLNVDMLSDPADIGGLTGVYATTKLALTTMGTAIAPELEQDGIMLRSVCPGAVITPMTKTSDAMPGILKFFVPLLFNKPEKQAGKMINAAKPDSFGGRTGIYITNGKEKAAPKLAVDASVQASLMKKLSVDAAL